MAGFYIAQTKVTDPDKYKHYSENAPTAIKAHNGKILVRGGETVPLEGPEPLGKIIMLEFESRDKVLEYYNSPEYKEVARHKENAAVTWFVALEGESTQDVGVNVGEKPGYFIAHVNITDMSRYEPYTKVATPLTQKYDGKLVARSDAVVLEGDIKPYQSNLIFAFPSLARAKEFYFSDEYQASIPMREGACECQFYLVEGI